MTSTKRKTWTAVAAVGFLVVLAVIIGVIATSGGDETAAPTPQPHPNPVLPPQDDQQPSGDQALPTMPPPARWELFSHVAVPVSAEAGPHHVDGAVADRYQRSPIGALIAAWQINTRSLLAPGDGWRDVVERQIVPGPGRDAYLAARSRVTDPTVSTEEVSQVAGFRFVTYSPDVAVIQVASRNSRGQLFGTTLTVRWVDGDWRLELQPNGAASPTATPLQDLTYYTPWGG